MTDEEKISQVAVLIAHGLGYDYADLYKNKSEGRNDRWQRHDINMVRQADCIEAARTVLGGLGLTEG